ncbi:MAG TPA: c-type cytochrome [Planctomycetota bacterium]|jgi:cytochrome c oxidase subunit 2
MSPAGFFPEQASSYAAQVDALVFYLTLAIAACVAVIVGLIISLAVRYRRRAEQPVPPAAALSPRLHLVWIAVLSCLCLGSYFWGVHLSSALRQEPANAIEIRVVGKQWMWKMQHPQGRREINELHVPRGAPIVLRLISEDVPHDLFIPALRLKQDALPGQYATEWFTATKTGEYPFYGVQESGLLHTSMRGTMFVMEPARYEAWLSGKLTEEPPAVAGEKLYNRLGCVTCHTTKAAPSLTGLYKTQVKLTVGEPVVADDAYLRESILDPNAKIVAGFQPMMPSFRGRITEDELTQLVSYIKSLRQ